MKNNNSLILSLAAVLLIAGIILGWVIKTNTAHAPKTISANTPVTIIHDTIKTPVINYKTIPGQTFNIDSLTSAINSFWKDSLKTLYGKGLFEAKFKSENNLGKHEFTLESRIPVDPLANLAIDEQLALPSVYSKRSFGLYCGLTLTPENGITGSLGAKYYILDYKNFSLTGSAGSLFPLKKAGLWGCFLNLSSELKF
jgi:hypothetical protein